MTRLLIGDDRLEHLRFHRLLYRYYRVTVHVITTFRMNCSRRYGRLEHQSDCLLQAITASKETEAPNVKAQGTGGPQFDYPMAVGQNINVDNVKYTITLNKI